MPETPTDIPGFYAVIPAGGSGTRLWPLSRRSSPKFLHDLTGSGRSLLQDTVHRLTPMCSTRVMVVTGVRHVEAVASSLPDMSSDNILVEPSPLDSMPAIGYAAAVLELRDPDAILGSFAADHVIGDPDAFRDSVCQAISVAKQGALVTLGIKPSYAATGYGYIGVGEPWTVPGAPAARHVDEFVEKPAREIAEGYLSSGSYLWNAGMFIVRATSLLEMLAQWHPQMVATLRKLAADPTRLEELWAELPAIAIDNAVAEPAAAQGQVAVVPADFPWDDVGDFASLAAVLEESTDHPGLRILGAQDMVVSRDTSGVIAAHGGRTVVTLGIPDVVVIDTPDAILVTTRERVQDVKGIVESLRRGGREELT